MRKENIFVVSTRPIDAEGIALGGITNYVVCAMSEDLAREHFSEMVPGRIITSATTLQALDHMAEKVRAVLNRRDRSWPLLVRPEDRETE